MNSSQSGYVRWKVFCLVLLAIVLLVVLWFAAQQPKRLETVEPRGAEVVDAASASGAGARSNTVSTSSTGTALHSRSAEIAGMVDWYYVPIEFWGLVVDQDEKPIADARVSVRIRSAKLSPSGTSMLDDPSQKIVETDLDGRFHVSGMRGDVLTVSKIEKPGYQLSTRAARSFRYGRSSDDFRPDVNAPVIYRMWKQSGKETLSITDPSMIAPASGELVGYNFSNFTEGHPPAENPDILFRFQRPLEISSSTTNRYDWRLEMSVAGGGLIEHNDELPYLAPENGYQPRYVIEMKADDPGWKERYETAFYVRGRDGRLFARVEMRFNSKSRQGGMLSMHCAANTNGSRNLEHDPRASSVR